MKEKMTYELTTDLKGVGIKQEEVSDEELAEWLEQTAEDLKEGKADNVLRFKVERRRSADD